MLCHHHHHHVVPLARISLTLSRHFSLSFIASGRSSGLHPESSHSCCMCVRAGRPAFARPYVGVHRSTSLMSSSLLLQQCPACLVCLTWIVFVMGGRWPYSWYLVGCCRQDLLNIARNILVYLPSSFFSSRLVSVQVVHPYSSIDTTAAWKGDLGLAKNYRGITLTSIAAKIYNALQRNRIEPKIDNILRKNQNGIRRNRSTTSQILTIRRILEGVRTKEKPYRRHYYLSIAMYHY